MFSDCKQDIDLSYKKFIDKITKLLDIHAPGKKLSHKEKKSLSKPWLTKGILQSIKQKNTLYRKFIRTKDLTKTELLLQDFKIYKNTIHKLTRINKSEYYKHYFEEHKNNSKKTWDGIRSIISLKTNSHKQIRSININYKTELNSKIMAETFNNFLVTIASDIDSKTIHTNTNYKDGLQDSELNSFFIKLATEKEVISVFDETKINESTGPNSIPTQILKIRNQIICKPLTYLINLSFSNRIFPALFKTSNVIPIFKRGENQEYNNYRPISLTSNLSKLMENFTPSLRKTPSFLSNNMVFVTNYPLLLI